MIAHLVALLERGDAGVQHVATHAIDGDFVSESQRQAGFDRLARAVRQGEIQLRIEFVDAFIERDIDVANLQLRLVLGVRDRTHRCN